MTGNHAGEERDVTAGAPDAGAGESAPRGLAAGLRSMLTAGRTRRREPSWQDLAQRLFFIVEAIDDYLYTDEHHSDGSVRTVYSGPTRARLLGGEPPADTNSAAEWARLVHPDDRSSHEAHRERLSRGEPSEVTYRLTGYDGVTRWVHARARPRQRDGHVLVDGIVSDVTRRVEAEVALAEAERDLRDQLTLNEYQARHDYLTGLGNRRMLVADLATLAGDATESDPLMLVLLDLDGFKRYNDTYGHPAGDALLTRLGKKLATAAGPASRCYRLGGDEFCVLHHGGDDAEATLESVAGALAERGEGYTIDCSFGAVSVPSETAQPSEALQLADQRLYVHKRTRIDRREAGHAALLQIMHERSPDLREHAASIAGLAQVIGASLGLRQDALEHLQQAALLRDIGLIAIPDSILEQPGPLTADERAAVELHSVIGERILSASPALEPVARIVRSHHERWDGNGYPDRLAGGECSIEARIVAVCDAFSALISWRPYRNAQTTSEALAEIRRHRATQFDPVVVDALAAACADPDLLAPAHARRHAS